MSRTTRLAISMVCVSSVVVMAASWSLTGSMSQARESFGRAVLDTGEVLVAAAGSGLLLKRGARFYTPVSGTWSSTGSMNSARQGFGIVRLTDGRFLTAGGSTTANGGVTSAAEIYDPVTARWTSVAPMLTARATKMSGDCDMGAIAVSDARLQLGRSLG